MFLFFSKKEQKANPLMKALTCIEISEDGECLGEEGKSIEDDSFISERFIIGSSSKRCQSGYKRANGKCRKVKTFDVKKTTKLSSSSTTEPSENVK